MGLSSEKFLGASSDYAQETRADSQVSYPSQMTDLRGTQVREDEQNGTGGAHRSEDLNTGSMIQADSTSSGEPNIVDITADGANKAIRHGRRGKKAHVASLAFSNAGDDVQRPAQM